LSPDCQLPKIFEFLGFFRKVAMSGPLRNCVDRERRSKETVQQRLIVGCVLWIAVGAANAVAQVPSLPGTTGTPVRVEGSKSAPADTVAAPTADNPEATASATAGPISVAASVPDADIHRTLNGLLPEYPGVTWVEIEVNDGIVKLEGQVDNEEVRANVTQFTRRVEGVRLILNRMKTDAQMLSGPQLAARMLGDLWTTVSQKWLLVVIAGVIVVAFSLLARLFNTHSEMLLSPLLSNALLRSVVGSLIGSLLFVAGLLAALKVLDLTQIVLSILGLAGIVGLAVGFAFRDIAENFIASVLLGMRRPFQVGDYVQVAGHAGLVQTLNTRATVLVTLDGKHVRIPNSTIFKEILVNSTASASTRSTYQLVIPYEASTAAALEAITASLQELDGVLENPPARALVEGLEPNGVKLQAYFWAPSQGIDGLKLLSDAKLKTKVALQRLGITAAPTQVAVAGTLVTEVTSDGADERHRAKNNLRKDSRAAANLTDASGEGADLPADHVMHEAETSVGAEGQNLLSSREKETSHGGA